MRTSQWAVCVALGLSGAAGCSGSVIPGDTGTGSSGGGGETSTGTSTGTGASPTCPPPEPTKHRPVGATCAPSTPPSGTPPTPCTTDADCKVTGPVSTAQGKCGASLVCDFNACATDADCGDGEVCSCEGESGGGGWNVENGSTCIPADCRVDADCGQGGYCSPTVSSTCGTYFGIAGYDCRTCQDTCVEDTDCPAEQGGPPGYCAYDPTVGHWACGYQFCVG